MHTHTDQIYTHTHTHTDLIYTHTLTHRHTDTDTHTQIGRASCRERV